MVENFKTIEQEIAELERALAEKKAALEQKKAATEIEGVPHEKEILKELVKEKIAAIPGLAEFPSAEAQPQPTQPIPPPPPVVEQPSYLSEELRPKVQELVNLAFEKSLDEAIKTAKATNNAALIKAFHAVIVDELYNYLVERGKLEVVK